MRRSTHGALIGEFLITYRSILLAAFSVTLAGSPAAGGQESLSCCAEAKQFDHRSVKYSVHYRSSKYT